LQFSEERASFYVPCWLARKWQILVV